MNCFKNQFRPHCVSSCLMNDLYGSHCGPTFRSAQPTRWEPTRFLITIRFYLDARWGSFGSILCAPGFYPRSVPKAPTYHPRKSCVVHSPSPTRSGTPFPVSGWWRSVSGRLGAGRLDWKLQDAALLRKQYVIRIANRSQEKSSRWVD